MNLSNGIPGSLYELNVVVDNPLFEGFALPLGTPSTQGRDSLDDDMTPGFGISTSNPVWEQVKLRENWTPPKVVGRVAPYNDFPGIDMVLPAFSKRACDVLRDLLEPNGELLPLRSTVGDFFFFNITTIVHYALDLEKSVCKFSCDPPTSIIDIDHFAFHRERLAGLSIFRIGEWPMSTIVTDSFVDRVNGAGLNGFRFSKIWPLDRKVNWRLEAKKARPQSVDRLKQHTLVVMVRLKSAAPDTNEKRLVERVEDLLDSKLAISSLEAPYLGRYEGSDVVDRNYCLFISCPDVDVLEELVRSWLGQFALPRASRLMKRYGMMWTLDALEVISPIHA